jgi:hypothetical protein
MRTPALAAAALATTAIAAPAAAARDKGRATCERQSEASFPGAYRSARNLRVGPLVLVGGRSYSTPETVREFGGQKYQALVAAGHTVKIAISHRAHRTHSLNYADSTRGTRNVEDGTRVVSFESCSRREAESDASGRAVTFWSGFILASAPRCLSIKVWVDGARTPRRARIPIGRCC